ncbi:MAG TPA: TetR/AcrR family transcriptional regulator [Trebonia sp.]|nr:TetR/AcrR family transcriptional regulator [Trebonia sp.]
MAGTHAGKPGLPRGRNRLPVPAVHASQRERLLRAIVAAVAQKGYPRVTVADIVHRAKVSRAAFYLHFRSREECFMAATRQGGQLLFGHVIEAVRAMPDGASDEETLRTGCRAFLRFLADEPAFARVFYIDMPAAGPDAVDWLQAATYRFAEINAKWHRRARGRHPDWPAVPEEAYQALAGGTAELVRSYVSADKASALPGLEDTLVAFHLAVMAGRRWPAAESGQEKPLALPPARYHNAWRSSRPRAGLPAESEESVNARNARLHRKASVDLFGGCGLCPAEC